MFMWDLTIKNIHICDRKVCYLGMFLSGSAATILMKRWINKVERNYLFRKYYIMLLDTEQNELIIIMLTCL